MTSLRVRGFFVGVFLVVACLVASQAHAQSLLSIEPGDDDVARYSIGTDGSLTFVDAVPVSTATDIAVRGDDAFAYVATCTPDSIVPLGVGSAATIMGEPLGLGICASAVALTRDGRRLYAADYYNGDIIVIDVDGLSMTVADVISNPGGSPFAMVLSPDGSRLFVSDDYNDIVDVIDTTTDTIITTIAVGTDPVSLAVSPDGATVYVLNCCDENVMPIDVATNTVGAPIDLSGLGPNWLAMSHDGSFLYVADVDDDSIAIINTETQTVVSTVSVPDVPYSVRLNAAGTSLYAMAPAIDTIFVYDVDALTGGLTPRSFAATGASPVFATTCRDGSGMLTSGATFLATDSNQPCFGGQADFAGGTLLLTTPDLNITTPIDVGYFGGTIDTNGFNATMSGPLTGALDPYGFHKAGAGTLTLLGEKAFGGAFDVDAGTLAFGSTDALPSTSAQVIMQTGSTVALNGFSQHLSYLGGTGTVSLGAATLTLSSGWLAGTVTGSGPLVKAGAQTLDISGTASHTGGTTVNAGKLRVGGTVNGTVTVNNTGVLTGAGTIAGVVTVNSGGLLDPGDAFGPVAPVSRAPRPECAPSTNGAPLSSGGIATFHVGNLQMNASSTLGMELNAVGGCLIGSDVLVVTGTVTLANPTLAVTLLSPPAVGQVFTLIDNDGSDPVVGTFAGLPQGSLLTVSGIPMRISYAGGTGNDVILTVVSMVDLALGMNAPSSVIAGNTLTYAITVGNLGPGVATAVTVADVLPTGTTFVSATPSQGTCGGTTTVSCALGSIASSGSATISLVVQTTPALQVGATISNTATVTTFDDDASAANNTASRMTTVACPAVSIGPATLPLAAVGFAYTQTFTMTNGTSPVTFGITGSVPGLQLSGSHLSGTPTSKGVFSITITGMDAYGCQASQPYAVPVARARQMGVSEGSGAAPTVRTFDVASWTTVLNFNAYDPLFLGGSSVAMGDINGDGIADVITGAGPGGGPHVKVFDGATGATLLSFFAYAPDLTAGVEVAVGDLDGDGTLEIVTSTGYSGPTAIRVFSGQTGALLREFVTPSPSAGSGLHVAVGDIDGDGRGEIIVGAGVFSLPIVDVLDGMTGAVLRESLAYASSFVGGVYVAAGDVNGDGYADIVTGAGPFGGPHVRVFDGPTGVQLPGPLGSFFAYTPFFQGGVRVATADLDRDGYADIIVGAGPGGGPHVRVLSGATGLELTGFFAFSPIFGGGTFVAGPATTSHMAVDVPQMNAAVTSPVRVAGWAFDDRGVVDSGIDAIHIWAFPVGGGSPHFVAATTPSLQRTDVGSAFGGEFLSSGFDVTGPLAPGTYDLAVYARNARSHLFTHVRVVRITVQ